jgi:hypothetical protein
MMTSAKKTKDPKKRKFFFKPRGFMDIHQIAIQLLQGMLSS